MPWRPPFCGTVAQKGQTGKTGKHGKKGKTGKTGKTGRRVVVCSAEG